MSATVAPIAESFPVLQTLQHQREAEAAMPVDAALVRQCRRLRQSQKPSFVAAAPQDWEVFNRESALLRDLVRSIAAIPATSRLGLRAKALALHALLDDGGGDLQEDAAAPDLLAWSLIQDILAD